MNTVRSGETSPRWIARPASIISAAITTSTSPGTGISDSTAVRPAEGLDHLDIVDRGAGALGDAGHRGRLRRRSPRLPRAPTIQSASTPPPWPPIATMATAIGRSAVTLPDGRAARSLASTLKPRETPGACPCSAACAQPGTGSATRCKGLSQCDASGIAPALQPADHHARRTRRQQPGPARDGIEHHVGAIERRAQHGGLGHLAAVAAAHAAVVDGGHRILLERIGRALDRKRRAAGQADAGVVASADVLVDAEAWLDAAARRA